MHVINSTRFRILISLFIVFILWQVFRRWSNQDAPENNDNNTKESASYGPVIVTVFYEALCPDSKYFIIKQLQPAFYKAPALIDFQLIPYGKATTSTNSDGSLSFLCQHGEIECNANIYHACCIEAIDEPKVLIDVIACMIRNNLLPKEAMQKCTREHQVEWEPIQKCYDSPHGAELLKMHGELTHALRPSVTFIPTITLNQSQGRQASILKDLLQEVCKVAGGHPDVCQ
ncbi:gamma-interferon-inducible lysosomal thiol reductase-like [Bradysia coprophila]|uniref:gamma-interferon-inducible lysosomal thiol reductase-like n=1 Tax=Bradysia coprophila TaxID=38358 RepID=UPI00187DA37F|nr:gamma-interferon-inducible lysosomal thiol reductase-like [Bradysia coprophila]